MEFKGSEKQIKWANDIVDKAKNAFENKVKEAESDKYADPEVLENYKNLYGIVTNVLSHLSSVCSASDVIENRLGLERGDLQAFGIKSFGGGRKIKVNGESYKGSDLKDENVRKEFEKKVLDYLRSKKK